MAKTPDFRAAPAGATRTPVAVPAHAAANAPRLDSAGPPVPSGTVVMTDYTRKQLTQLGWKEGDPLPGDLGARIAEIQLEVAKERATATLQIPPGWTPPKHQLVNIADLPADKQQELRGYLEEYKATVAQEAVEEHARQERERAINPASPPSVQEAHRVALEASRPAAKFVNDLPAQQPPSIPVPEGRQLGGVSGISPAFAAIQAAKEQAVAPPVEPEPAADTGTTLPVLNCPRCTWDLRLAFNVEATAQDKIVFRAGILGGKRFHKQVSLFDGSFRIRFRSLTATETRMLRQQLRYDLQAGRVVGEGEFYAEMMEYRLIMSVEQLTQGDDTFDIPAIAEIPYEPPKPDEPPQTALVPMREWFFKEVAPTETLLKVIRDQHHQFQRLVEYLETVAQDADFWKGIEPQR